MEQVKILQIKQSVFANNDAQAEALRRELKERKLYLLNLMSSPGSGKTTTLTRLIAALKDQLRIGVMEADIDSDVDAAMTRQGLEGLEPEALDLVILENVGNLVCPAEFDTGAVKNCMILSVPEGHDKPLKYPLMFQVCDTVIINKTDVLPYFDFDMDKCAEYIRLRNPNARIFPISAKTGQGVEALADWLKEEVRNWKGD